MSSLTEKRSTERWYFSRPCSCADIFTFYNDQFEDYYAANVLKEIDENAEEVLKESGGKDSAAADVCTVDGKLYAYPLTTGNGYFLYYNKKFLSEMMYRALTRF